MESPDEGSQQPFVPPADEVTTANPLLAGARDLQKIRKLQRIQSGVHGKDEDNKDTDEQESSWLIMMNLQQPKMFAQRRTNART